MPRFHFSLRTFFLVVLLLAVSFAAMSSGARWVANVAFTANLALLCFAVVGAMVRTGNGRVFWVGVAVFGWVYYFSTHDVLPNQWRQSLWSPYPMYYGNAQPEEPQGLITEKLLTALSEMQTPTQLGQSVVAQWQGGGYWPGKIKAVQNGQYEIAWDDGSTPTWVTRGQIQGNPEPFFRTGHAVLGILLSLAAGGICAWLLGKSETSATSDKSASVAGGS